MDETSHDEWAALYAAAATFRELAPWKWMTPYQMFAVQNPENGEMAYCAVIGSSDKGLGLTAFIGAEGWKFLRAVRTPRRPSTEETIRYGQKSLVLLFEKRTADVDSLDRDLAKQSRCDLSGPIPWPVFRSYQPGFAGWYLNRAEVHFFTRILEQAVALCQRVLDRPQILSPQHEGTLFARIPNPIQASSEAVTWSDGWTQLPRASEEAYASAWVDARRVKQATRGAKRCPPWEVDIAFAPYKFTLDGRPRFPRLLMCVDATSGEVYAVSNLSGLQDGAESDAVTEQLLQTIGQINRYPTRIFTARSDVSYLLTPLATSLGIQVVERHTLPMLDKARQSLFNRFKR